MKCVELSLAMLVSLALIESRIATPVEENVASVPTEGGQDLQEEVVQENVDDEKQCHSKPDGVLDSRDMTLVDLARKLETLAPNLTDSEMDLLAEMLDNDGCTEDEVKSAMERYNNGEAEEHHRAKRATCSKQCSNSGTVVTNCSYGCTCRCNWWGYARCRCCVSRWFC